MERMQIEEFPGLDPGVVRAAVIGTAKAAHAAVCSGHRVCGVTISLENGLLVGRTRVLTNKSNG
jgi:hypothetical protein